MSECCGRVRCFWDSKFIDGVPYIIHLNDSSMICYSCEEHLDKISDLYIPCGFRLCGTNYYNDEYVKIKTRGHHESIIRIVKSINKKSAHALSLMSNGGKKMSVCVFCGEKEEETRYQAPTTKKR